MFADGSPRDALFWGTDPVWFQIARMQFSPYTPRLHRMLEIAPEDEQYEMANAAGDETVLKAIIRIKVSAISRVQGKGDCRCKDKQSQVYRHKYDDKFAHAKTI